METGNGNTGRLDHKRGSEAGEQLSRPRSSRSNSLLKQQRCSAMGVSYGVFCFHVAGASAFSDARVVMQDRVYRCSHVLLLVHSFVDELCSNSM